MINRFPKDCWKKKCPHFKVWDLSIDDLCCYCELLKVQCDACDEDFSFYICPSTQQNDCKEETTMSRNLKPEYINKIRKIEAPKREAEENVQ